MVVPVLVARGIILLFLLEEPPPAADCFWSCVSMRTLRWTLSKLKPPEGVFESRPMSGLVNSDIVYFGVASMKYLFLLVCSRGRGGFGGFHPTSKLQTSSFGFIGITLIVTLTYFSVFTYTSLQ